MSGILRKCLRLSFRQKMLLPEAVFLSAYYRFLLLHAPFAKLSRRIGIFGYETPFDANDHRMVYAVRVVVEAVCRHTPWESKCLVRALTAKKMLNRRGCLCTLYMGVKQTEDGTMDAHAWLRYGDIFVTGGKGDGYAVTGLFGDKSL